MERRSGIACQTNTKPASGAVSISIICINPGPELQDAVRSKRQSKSTSDWNKTHTAKSLLCGLYTERKCHSWGYFLLYHGPSKLPPAHARPSRCCRPRETREHNIGDWSFALNWLQQPFGACVLLAKFSINKQRRLILKTSVVLWWFSFQKPAVSSNPTKPWAAS